jgi:hypothetical protein
MHKEEIVKRTLLLVKELSVALGISERSVRRAYLKGEIPGARICRMLRFDLQRVLQVMHATALSHALREGAVRVGASRPRGHRRSRKAPESVTRGLS